jgi:hypothetical protein
MLTNLLHDVVTYSLDEFTRSGNFTLLFPKEENVEYYSRFYNDPDEENIMLWLWLKNKPYELLPTKQVYENKNLIV